MSTTDSDSSKATDAPKVPTTQPTPKKTVTPTDTTPVAKQSFLRRYLYLIIIAIIILLILLLLAIWYFYFRRPKQMTL